MSRNIYLVIKIIFISLLLQSIVYADKPQEYKVPDYSDNSGVILDGSVDAAELEVQWNYPRYSVTIDVETLDLVTKIVTLTKAIVSWWYRWFICFWMVVSEVVLLICFGGEINRREKLAVECQHHKS